MLKWESYFPSLPDNVVAGAELILGVKLPDGYRALAQAWPGGHPDRTDFVVNHSRRSWVSCVGALLSLDPRQPENVFQSIADLAIDSQLPASLLPIITDGGGDLLCLDYRGNKDEPAVVYWAHELGGDEAVVPVSPSFDSFLQLLEDEAAAPPRQDSDEGACRCSRRWRRRDIGVASRRPLGGAPAAERQGVRRTEWR